MKELLGHIITGGTLSIDQAAEAFDLIMTGEATPAQVGAMLAMLQQRGPTVDEITGAAQVMRRMATAVEVPAGLTVIDTCGTGGDHSGTFNISTAAALVAAAAGRPQGIAVAKHGNRSITSQSGSSQVLEALGVSLETSGPALTRCLDEAGICFCFAPRHHPAMKHAMPIRLDLGFRTIFNVLGPLTNPAGAARQVMGVFDPALTEPIADVLANLGAQAAMVVHGRMGDHPLDELSTGGTSTVHHLDGGRIRRFEIEPEDLGLGRADPAALQVDGPDSSAAVIRGVLAGEKGPARDIVALNAAAALVVAGIADDLAGGLGLAGEALDSGAASRALDRLVAVTQEAD
ncbi:MAG: anthranilate phosphoribosyltransferase [Phycisphaeraceae bacterium]|nr:anthranilate phosphoribosyltransferase [Phycisphaeraceae bacterium]